MAGGHQLKEHGAEVREPTVERLIVGLFGRGGFDVGCQLSFLRTKGPCYKTEVASEKVS